jgi:phage baseplate assembly protein W
MSNRSDKFTIESKKVTQYSDFLNGFDKNPQTGFLAMVSNEESVKQSIRNLILTERTERFYRPHIGSKIMSLLFEPIDIVTEELLKTTITETIKNNEPRAQLVSVSITPMHEYNAYVVAVAFSIINIPSETFDLTVILKRVR